MEREHAVEAVVDGPVAILRVEGNITSGEISPLPEKFAEAAKQGARAVILRFTPSTYINSAGMGLLISLAGDAQQSGQRVGVCNLSGHLRKMFDVLGLFEFLELYDDEEEALLNILKRKKK